MNQEIGKRFPDLELPDQDNNKVKLIRHFQWPATFRHFLSGLLVTEMPGPVTEPDTDPGRVSHRL